MEWLEQTKKISKSVDYIALDLIDSVLAILVHLDPKIIREHQKFFEYYCKLYHKPSPLKLLPRKTQTNCHSVRKAFSVYVDQSIKRIEKQKEAVTWQIFEIIDFIYERPELINPEFIGEYMRDRIQEVCAEHRKNNPLMNGFSKKLGKFWKDEDGKWQPERRKRF
jgi:hypothetical protein